MNLSTLRSNQKVISPQIKVYLRYIYRVFDINVSIHLSQTSRPEQAVL